MKHYIIFVFIAILSVTACSINSPTPSMSSVTPADSSIIDLENITYIEFYLPDFEQEIQLQISDDFSFLTILYDNVFHEENYHYLPIDFFRKNTTYFWRIRGRNPDNDTSILVFFHYNWSEWSKSNCFFTQ